jgi:septum formation protein
MLKTLSGNSHQVITSVCIKTFNKQHVFSDTTIVNFKELSTDEIKFYVENYKPYDKAGAYGIQEWIGFIGVSSISGCYYNVMGLPVNKLYEELKKI